MHRKGADVKIFVRVVVLLLVVGAGAGAYWLNFASPKAATVPNTVVVGKGTIETTVLASGALQANGLVSVGAEVSGRIETIDVKLGQDVRTGDQIATIDSLNQENAVKAAQASLAVTNAQKSAKAAALLQAQTTLTRQTQMLSRKLIAQSDFETAQAAVNSAQADIDGVGAQIAQANLAVEQAQLDLSRTRIVAPSNGTIVAVMVEQGQTVNAANSSPTIVKIADLDTMVIKAEISEADVTRVKAGQPVYFTILGEPDNKIVATLREIEPAPTSIASDTTATDTSSTAIYYNGLFDVPNPGHKLRISMTAQVTIVLAQAKDALLVPAGVLKAGRDGQQLVLVYDPDTQTEHLQPVTVGLTNNIQAQITAGLVEGDQVVQATSGAAAANGGTGGNRNGGNFGGGLLGGGPPAGGPRG